MANAKIQPFTSLDHSKHHCYTLSTTCTLFKLASEVGPRTISALYPGGTGDYQGRPIFNIKKNALSCGVIFHILTQRDKCHVSSVVSFSNEVVCSRKLDISKSNFLHL